MERWKISTLEEGKYYTVSFDDRDTFIHQMDIIEIKVLIKLENSIKIKLLVEGKDKWFPTNKFIHIFDEIPIKYFRKEKLKKLEELE